MHVGAVALSVTIAAAASGAAWQSSSGFVPVPVPGRAPNRHVCRASTGTSHSPRCRWRSIAALLAKGGSEADDDDRDLSVLEAEEARLRAELEAAKLKAQLAKLQKEMNGDVSPARDTSQASGSADRRQRGKTGQGSRNRSGLDDPFGGPDQPVSRKTGLKPAVPLSAKGSWAGTSRGRSDSTASSSPQPPSYPPQASSTPSKPASGTLRGEGPSLFSVKAPTGMSPEKEARYVEVMEELVGALQEVNNADPTVDLKALVSTLVQSRPPDGAPGAPATTSSFSEEEVLQAMKDGAGNALVRRIIEGVGDPTTLMQLKTEQSGPSRLERLVAWGSLVVKTISSNKYLLTADKVLGMKELADWLLPRNEFSSADVNVVHLAVIREVGQSNADEYPDIRRRRANMLYVLLNLPRSFRDESMHREEIAIGQTISMESSLGQGSRTVFETTLSDLMPSSTDMVTEDAFRSAVRALREFGESARHVLASTNLPAPDALKGVTLFLVPWLRRVVKRALDDGAAEDVAVARLSMVMELARHSAECMALVKLSGSLGAESSQPVDEAVVKQMLAERINGVGVELSSAARQNIMAGYIRSWTASCLMSRSLPVQWVDGEARVRPGDIAAWELARQVLALSEVQLMFVAKETVPNVVGELMAEVLLEKAGEWPQGHLAFVKDYNRIYERLKYDKYEGNFARCKAIRVLADSVLERTGGNEEERSGAVEWGCQSLDLRLEDFGELADQQATFELQTDLLEKVLGPAGRPVEELGEAIAGMAQKLRLRPESVGKATAAAVQVHIGNLAARALFADMEGQTVKAFKEIDATLRFIEHDATYLADRFDCTINPIARIPEEDGLQLANLCTKMLSRRQFTESASRFIQRLGYSDRIV